MTFNETIYYGTEWINLAHDRRQWQDLVYMVINRVRKRKGIAGPAEQLPASQQGLCSMVLVSHLTYSAAFLTLSSLTNTDTSIQMMNVVISSTECPVTGHAQWGYAKYLQSALWPLASVTS